MLFLCILYRWWLVPYYWAGSKLYDLVAAGERLEASYFMTRSRALEAFPMLRRENLAGAMVYYDGQHNDSRMNVALAMTAAREGATVANHMEVVQLLFEQTPMESSLEDIAVSESTSLDAEAKKVVGAIVRDRLTGEEFSVYAKVRVFVKLHLTSFSGGG